MTKMKNERAALPSQLLCRNPMRDREEESSIKKEPDPMRIPNFILSLYRSCSHKVKLGQWGYYRKKKKKYFARRQQCTKVDSKLLSPLLKPSAVSAFLFRRKKAIFSPPQNLCLRQKCFHPLLVSVLLCNFFCVRCTIPLSFLLALQ